MIEASPYIESIFINIFDGKFNSEIKFKAGLNIISGVNGTGKTQLIQLLKSSDTRKFFNEVVTDRVVVFNPLRNAEKKTQEEIRQKLRSQDLNTKKINDVFRGLTINDQTLTSLYSFGELFVLTYEDLLFAGKISIEDAVERVRNDFNSVLRRVFPEYEIVAIWTDKQLTLNLKKETSIEVPLTTLSRGESEVLSLLFNIYANRQEEDIFLIDEPELHLNWDLERGLFNFLDWFCEEFKKQIITTTHSRIIFESKFLPKSQFLVWDNGKIAVKSEPTEEIRKKIGGDAFQLISALDIKDAVVYVEDEAQKQIVEYLAEHLSKSIFVSIAGNKINVINLCQYFAQQNIKNALFLVDSDNEGLGIELQNNLSFIQLQKNCIENYLLNNKVLSKVFNTTQKKIKEEIKQAIRTLSHDKYTVVFKKLADSNFLTEEILDLYNGKKLLEKLFFKYNVSDKNKFILNYLEKSKSLGKLDESFTEILEKLKAIS